MVGPRISSRRFPKTRSAHPWIGRGYTRKNCARPRPISSAAQFVAFIRPSFSANFAGLLPIQILYSLRQAVSLPGLTAQDILWMVGLGAGYMVVATLMGLLVFHKSDIE